MLKLKALSVAPYGTNCYLLTCPETKQALLIDPAGDAEAILEMCASVDARRILITHGHGDHIMALDEVREALQVPVGIHPADAENFGIAADFELQDGMELEVGSHQVRIVHIPGHTPGSCAIRFDKRAVVGDTIFQGGPGASRSPEALETSLVSLQRTVFTWPDDTVMFNGHGDPATVGVERPAFQEFLARPRPADMCGDVTWEVT